MAAGTLVYPREAKADHFGPGINVDFVNAHMDGSATLFVCTAGDGTTVGTWRRVQTVAVT